MPLYRLKSQQSNSNITKQKRSQRATWLEIPKAPLDLPIKSVCCYGNTAHILVVSGGSQAKKKKRLIKVKCLCRPLWSSAVTVLMLFCAELWSQWTSDLLLCCVWMWLYNWNSFSNIYFHYQILWNVFPFSHPKRYKRMNLISVTQASQMLLLSGNIFFFPWKNMHSFFLSKGLTHHLRYTATFPLQSCSTVGFEVRKHIQIHQTSTFQTIKI